LCRLTVLTGLSFASGRSATSLRVALATSKPASVR